MGGALRGAPACCCSAVAADSRSPAPALALTLALAVWLQPSTLPIAAKRRARAVAACLRLAPPRNAEWPRPDRAQDRGRTVRRTEQA